MAKITIEYCSKYKSYNGEEVIEGKVLAPVMISDDEFKYNNTIIPENLKTWKHYGVPFRVGFMVVDEAEFDKMLSLYYGCINDYFDEHPELRPGRCVLGWDSEGFPILCGKENRCKNCPRRAEHLPRYKNREDFITFVSFQDTHEDEDGNTVGLDIADPNVNVEEEESSKRSSRSWWNTWAKSAPVTPRSSHSAGQDYSKEQIIAELGLKLSRGYQEIAAAKELTKKFLEL